jgi:hypothetical protein
MKQLSRRRFLRLVGSTAVLAGPARLAVAQSYPARPKATLRTADIRALEEGGAFRNWREPEVRESAADFRLSAVPHCAGKCIEPRFALPRL